MIETLALIIAMTLPHPKQPTPIQYQDNPEAVSNCVDQATLVSSLLNLGQFPRSGGMTGPTQVEIWTSQNGDWTAVLHVDTDVSCVLQTGTDWERYGKGM